MKTISFTSTPEMISGIKSAISNLKISDSKSALFHADYGDEGVIIFPTAKKLMGEVRRNCNGNWRKVEVFQNRSGGVTVAIK